MPDPTTQPRVRRNEWQALAVPATGTWDPTLSVTVVVPAYTAGTLLPTVLAGLDAQTYPAHLLEVLVVDDGPVRGDLVLPELRPERTRVVRPDDDGPVGPGGWGRAHACHLGALAAEGDVLHWLDADMLLERDQVEAQLRWHHVLDHVVTLGTKSFVDPAPALARTPAEVRDGVASGVMPSWWDGLEQTPHTWVEEIFARTDDLRAIGWNAFRTHTGAVAAVSRALYLASGGMDPTLRLGEDIALGGRLAEVGAVFVPDREARSLHLGHTHVMSRAARVNDYNEPFLADRVPALHAHRRRGRSYSAPYLEVVLDSRGEEWSAVAATVDAVLASTLTDLEVVLVGDWDELVEERHAVLDRSVDVRILHETYAADPRVRLVTEVPPAEGPRRSPWRMTLPGTAWGPGRAALERVLLHLEHTHDGLRLVHLPDGTVARVERTAAVARAARTRRPDEPLDAVLAEVAGVGEVAAEEREGARVRFLPAADARPRLHPRFGGPATDDDEAWRRIDRALGYRR